MTAIHWLGAVDGSFTNASDWSGGMVPGASDDAILDAVGASPYTVTSSVSETVYSLRTDAQATLAVTGGTFTASDGTGSGANAGVVLVGAGATLAAGGVVSNTGLIALHGTGRETGVAALHVDGYATLTGGGEILLGGSDDMITVEWMQGLKYSVLYNMDNTIVGSGKIGGKKFDITNEQGGTIDANGSAPLNIVSFVENDGLIEATGTGGLNLTAGGRLYPTGVLLAGDGSSIRTDAETYLRGGTLRSVGSGSIVARGGYIGQNITNDANLISDGAIFRGIITNNATITASTNGILDGGFTLLGEGVVELSGSGITAYPGNPGTQVVDLASGTIEGGGTIGFVSGNEVGLTIGAAGVINGDDAKVNLSIDTEARVITNAGTIESTAAGGVVVYSPIANAGTLSATAGLFAVGMTDLPQSIVNTGTIGVSGRGTLIAYGAVTGKGVATIGGGTLDFASGFDEAVQFTGKTGVLELAESQAYANKIVGFSANGKTSLDLGDIGFVGAGEATFSGTPASGVLTVTDGTHTAHITLVGDYLSDTFVASSDGHGGTDVVADKTKDASVPTPHAFVAAMAGFGAPAGEGVHAVMLSHVACPMLFSPRVNIA